jgi:hypothetical protein
MILFLPITLISPKTIYAVTLTSYSVFIITLHSSTVFQKYRTHDMLIGVYLAQISGVCN